MPNNQLPYDTSFAYAFQWTRPEEDLKKALEILTALVDDQHDLKNCPAGNPDYHPINKVLASNPSTPAQVLAHIAQCVSCPQVLERIAGHPNTSAETLKLLAASEYYEVRSAVAENSTADIEILYMLAKDEHADVRFAIAENPNVPAAILQELVNDENPYVAYRAQVTLTRTGAATGSIKAMKPQNISQQTRRRAM